MKNETILGKWNNLINDPIYKKYFMSNEDEWINKLNELKSYIDNNNKKPLRNDKDKETKILAKWLSHQLQNYKNKKLIMKNEIIYCIWSEFIKEYKKYFISNGFEWIDTLNKIKIYIDENKKRNTTIEKN